MSLSIQIINFILLIGILNFILYRPIRKILSERKEKVSGLESSIEKSENDAKEKSDAFALGLKDARAEGVKKKESLLQEAAKKEKEIISKINDEAAAELAKVRDKIAGDAEGVRASLQKEIDAFATDIGKKILGRAI
jgi:F-type H+-transporting ATPase subunit b